jgi:hypothetical protein
MKLSRAFAIFSDLWMGLRIAFWPTCIAVWQTPILLLQPRRLSQTLFTPIWDVLGVFADQACSPVKDKLITPDAYGSVLDLGAGNSITCSQFWILLMFYFKRVWTYDEIS